jgi:hypothetical protein
MDGWLVEAAAANAIRKKAACEHVHATLSDSSCWQHHPNQSSNIIIIRE